MNIPHAALGISTKLDIKTGRFQGSTAIIGPVDCALDRINLLALLLDFTKAIRGGYGISVGDTRFDALFVVHQYDSVIAWVYGVVQTALDDLADEPDALDIATSVIGEENLAWGYENFEAAEEDEPDPAPFEEVTTEDVEKWLEQTDYGKLPLPTMSDAELEDELAKMRESRTSVEFNLAVGRKKPRGMGILGPDGNPLVRE